MPIKQALSLSILYLFSLINTYGQFLSQGEIAYLKNNAQSISVDSNYSNGNWSSLLQEIKNYNIVSIGEFNHGSQEVFAARNDLITALHEELGFNVVLFESGIGEVAAVELFRDKLSPKQMTLSLFWNWRTEDFKDLMNYIKVNKMKVGGFDVQRTGGFFTRLLEIEATNHNIDTLSYKQLEQNFLSLKRKLTNNTITYDSVAQDVNDLIIAYQFIDSLITKEQAQELPKITRLVSKTISNRIQYLNYRLDFLKNGDKHQRWKARDSAMADNVSWMIKHLYPDEKIIIIAHNFHISKYNEKESVMGEYLADQFKDQMYVLGVFAEKGTYQQNGIKKMVPPNNHQLDIKHVIQVLNDKISFIPIPKKQQTNFQWIYNKIIINDTFIDLNGSNKINLSKHFDGLLLFKKITPSKNLEWN